MQALQERWEEKLAREGLAALDGRGSMVSKRSAHPSRREDADDSIRDWLSWAKGLLDTHLFRAPRDQKVWELYAQGHTYTEIEDLLGINRRDVSRSVAAVEQDAPPAPCPNPWRKSGRDGEREEDAGSLAKRSDPRVTARLLELAVSCADPVTLAGLVSMDERLQRLTGGMTMAEVVKRVAEVRYTSIKLRKNETVRAPDKSAWLDVLLPPKFGGSLVGRPHAGGIDVSTGDGRVITVPWWKIDVAERAVEE